MRYKVSKRILIFLCLFVSIGALIGSICMFIDPSGELLGMSDLLPYFKVLPLSNILFQDYIFSGISLLIVNGISNLIAVYFLIKNRMLGSILGMVFGITLMLWIIIQFIIFPTNILSISFFIIGTIEFLFGYMTYVFYKQENFKFDIDDYKILKDKSDTLVVYFSRMGYTRKIAYDEAIKNKANILELKTSELTSSTKGFWWCGRFGMHKWCMKINDINVDLKKYKKVIIISPIWVFSISAPIRDFCYKYKSDINNVEYIFVHFMKTNFLRVSDEVDKILNKKRIKYTSICSRFGKVIKYNVYK